MHFKYHLLKQKDSNEKKLCKIVFAALYKFTKNFLNDRLHVKSIT